MAVNMDHMGSQTPPKSLDDMLREVAELEGRSRKLFKLDEYCKKLENERYKVDVFERELPYCKHLLTDALDILKTQVMHCSKSQERRPGTKALMPLKGICSKEDDLGSVEEVNIDDLSNKRSWMRSVQLWNSGTNYDQEKQGSVTDQNVVEITDDNWSSTCEDPIELSDNRNKDVPFTGHFTSPGAAREENKVSRVISYHGTTIPVTKLELGSCSAKISFNRREKFLYPPQPEHVELQLAHKKTRRIWSADLHRLFLMALEKLGGAEAATPKQIKALMEVDGLTTSEVKSHLQKYRLHNRVSSDAPAPRRWRFDQYEDHLSFNLQPDHLGPLQGSFLPHGSAT